MPSFKRVGKMVKTHLRGQSARTQDPSDTHNTVQRHDRDSGFEIVESRSSSSDFESTGNDSDGSCFDEGYDLVPPTGAPASAPTPAPAPAPPTAKPRDHPRASKQTNPAPRPATLDSPPVVVGPDGKERERDLAKVLGQCPFSSAPAHTPNPAPAPATARDGKRGAGGSTLRGFCLLMVLFSSVVAGGGWAMLSSMASERIADAGGEPLLLESAMTLPDKPITPRGVDLLVVLKAPQGYTPANPVHWSLEVLGAHTDSWQQVLTHKLAEGGEPALQVAEGWVPEERVEDWGLGGGPEWGPLMRLKVHQTLGNSNGINVGELAISIRYDPDDSYYPLVLSDPSSPGGNSPHDKGPEKAMDGDESTYWMEWKKANLLFRAFSEKL